MSDRLPIAVSLVFLALAFVGARDARAQNFILVPTPADTGYSDPTPVTSDITGEPTTLGADRTACLEAAFAVLENHLDLSVDVRVLSEFAPLFGNEFSAVLGFAGPITVFKDYAGAPLLDTFFSIAEASQHAGTDLASGIDDVAAVFNSDVDGPVVLGSLRWYYGIDGKPPANTIDFFSTALHEICHGIGFLSMMDLDTGVLTSGGFRDIYTSQLRREGAASADYDDMTNEERAAANVSDEVVWKGALTQVLVGGPVPIYSPNPLRPGSSISHWDPTVTFDPFTLETIDDPDRPNLLMEPFATEPFTDLSIELQAFADILWPLTFNPLTDSFVDFNYVGPENGTRTLPYDTAIEGASAIASGGTVHFDEGSSDETGVFSKPMTWVKEDGEGSVIIGQPDP